MNPAGREWFDIDDRVNGPVAAAPVIDAAITAALAALKLPASALALAGFSQGGMMSPSLRVTPCRTLSGHCQFFRCASTA
jgi:predicted esterase